MLTEEEIKAIERDGRDYAFSEVPHPNSNDAPYYTTGDKWDDILRAYLTAAIQERIRAKALIEAASEILHLHLCEQEGLSSGQPSPKQWLTAVYNLSNSINSYNTKQIEP